MNVPAQQLPPQARSVAAPQRWPLVSRLQTRASSVPLTKDARLVNCYAEYDAEDKEWWIYKRLGLSTTPFITESGTGNGIYTFSATPVNAANQVLSVYGGTLYSTAIDYATGLFVTTQVGTGLNSVAPYWFETVNTVVSSVNTPVVVLGNGNQAYVYNPALGTFGDISGTGSFPGIFMQGWAYLDGTLYVMDPFGNIWGSAINNPQSWTATNVIEASSNSDLGMGLFKQLSYVIALKQWTGQVFYDAGTGGGVDSNLAPVPDSQIPLGCLMGSSIQSIDNTALWVTSNQSMSPQVVRMDNLIPKIVSTPAVDRILQELVYTAIGTTYINNGVISWAIKHAGHRFYGLTIQALNLTLVYDIDQDLWYLWTDANGNYWPVQGIAFYSASQRVSSGPFYPGFHIAQHVSNGNAYQLDGQWAYPNDYGTVFPVDIYTPNFDAGVMRRKQLNGMYFRGDQVPGSKLLARFSDDDYQSWSNFREVDLSLREPRLTRCGTFKNRRAYHFRHQLNTTFRVKSVDLQMDIGTL